MWCVCGCVALCHHQVCCGLNGCCTTKRCINNATTGFEPKCCGDDCNIGQSLNCCPGGQICYNVTGQTVSGGLRRRWRAACVDAAEHCTSDPGVVLHLLAHISRANCPLPSVQLPAAVMQAGTAASVNASNSLTLCTSAHPPPPPPPLPPAPAAAAGCRTKPVARLVGCAVMLGPGRVAALARPAAAIATAATRSPTRSLSRCARTTTSQVRGGSTVQAGRCVLLVAGGCCCRRAAGVMLAGLPLREAGTQGRGFMDSRAGRDPLVLSTLFNLGVSRVPSWCCPTPVCVEGVHRGCARLTC